MSSTEQILSIFLFIILLYFYLRYKKKFSYWRQRNIKHDTPWPVIGNHGPKIFNLMTNGELCVMLAQKYYAEDFIGYYRGETPELYVLNPKFYPYILNSDFDHFYARAVDGNTKEERMLMNLFNCSGDYWKLLRQRLTPAFSSHKLVKMTPLIALCAGKLQVAAEDVVKRGGHVDAFDLMARYTIECICSCGFGLDADNINKKDNFQFLYLGTNIFKRSTWHTHLLAIIEAVPSIGEMLRSVLNVYRINPKIKAALIELVKNVRKERNFKPSTRNDFIDLLMELESLGKMRGFSFENNNPDGTPIEVELEMDIEILAAQVYIFFAAGYATSAIASSMTLHFLAFNPNVQTRIQKHIDATLAKHENKITYESIFEMNLLEMAVKEAMRLFPPSSSLSKICTRKYTFPGTDLTIDAGVRVVIPSNVLNKDAKYYENPAEFIPERFLPDEASKRPKYSYLAFGEGQRKCIGARLGMIMSMAGVAAIIQRFNVELAPTSTQDLKIDRNVFTVNFVEGGVPVKLVPRDNFIE